jgi:SRSO17 transposase
MGELRGLLSEGERKTRGPVAEAGGESTPAGFQHLRARADGDADLVRDELRTERIQPLGAPNGVWGLDATGNVDKGRHSAGVARQYTGTVGHVENGLIGVCRGDASPLGHA